MTRFLDWILRRKPKGYRFPNGGGIPRVERLIEREYPSLGSWFHEIMYHSLPPFVDVRQDHETGAVRVTYRL